MTGDLATALIIGGIIAMLLAILWWAIEAFLRAAERGDPLP